MSKRRSWINYLGLLWMSRTFSCAPTRRRMATQNRHFFKYQSIVLSTGFNFNNNFQRYLPSSSSCSATPWRSQQQVWRNSWKHLLKINPTLLRQFPTLSSLGSNTCVPKNGKPCEYLAIFPFYTNVFIFRRDLANMFLHFTNHWNLDTPSKQKQNMTGENFSEYRVVQRMK